MVRPRSPDTHRTRMQGDNRTMSDQEDASNAQERTFPATHCVWVVCGIWVVVAALTHLHVLPANVVESYALGGEGGFLPLQLLTYSFMPNPGASPVWGALIIAFSTVCLWWLVSNDRSRVHGWDFVRLYSAATVTVGLVAWGSGQGGDATSVVYGSWAPIGMIVGAAATNASGRRMQAICLCWCALRVFYAVYGWRWTGEYGANTVVASALPVAMGFGYGLIVKRLRLRTLKAMTREMRVEIAPGVEMAFCWCPATATEAWKRTHGGVDAFVMGSPASEKGRDSEETQRRVKLTQGFWMGKYEVTQAQWETVMGCNPSGFKETGSDAPVERVSWEDCQDFVKELNAGVDGGGFRLPMEAEWEYACRAGTTTALNSGEELMSATGSCRNLDEVAWYSENSGNATHPVGQKRANAWGLYDMHGNVCEWCQDWTEEYPSGRTIDPVGQQSGGRRVYRGGSWSYVAGPCRSASRSEGSRGCRYSVVGLRLVRTAQ